jgi:hypothetical protein
MAFWRPRDPHAGLCIAGRHGGVTRLSGAVDNAVVHTRRQGLVASRAKFHHPATAHRAANRGWQMATGEKPAIVDTAVAGWRDAFNALAAMPVTCGITFVIMLVLSGLSVLFLPQPMVEEGGAGLGVMNVIVGIIQSFLLAPLAIAVHRYVLLGERATGYALDPSSPRYLRFVGFAVLVNLLLLVPSVIITVAPPEGDNVALGAAGGLAAFVLFIVILIVVLRRAILFPAIAVDAPGASWSNARNDTKGNSWRVFFILLCTVIPVLVVSLPLYWLLMRQAVATPTSRLVFVVLSTIVQVPTICAFAAVASHVFRALADRLARPAGAPA